MYISKNKIICLLAIIIIIISATAVALGSDLSGRVINKNGNPLPGANIIVDKKIVNGQEVELESKVGTAADIDGNFIISSISPDTYIIRVTYIGYKPKEIVVTIKTDQTINRTITLENVSVKGEEVIVSAQAKGQMDAINKQLASQTIKNVVATDRIQENPDANAAEAIGRLPGVSVIRSGGEATDFMIRGLDPKYNKVKLNGVELPSNKGAARNASLSGISQYALQEVEISKSITPDMEANAVSGVVNMQLKEASKGFNANLMVQPGYNNQNDDWKNYKLNGNISKRFLDGKLGLNLNLNASRINRSTERMTAAYGIQTYAGEELYLNMANLNDVTNIKYKKSGSLVMDYQFAPYSSIKLSSFYSRNSDDLTQVTKSYNPVNSDLNYSINQNRDNFSNLFSTDLQGNHLLGNMNIDYGISYSRSEVNHPEHRQWQFVNNLAFSDSAASQEVRQRHPSEIIPMAQDDTTRSSMTKFFLNNLSYSTYEMNETHINSYIDFKYPFQIGNKFSGFIKFGGKYKRKDRFQDQDYYFRWVNRNMSPTFNNNLEKRFDWAVPSPEGGMSMVNLYDHTEGEFLQGGFDFGWYPDIDRLNDIFTWWQKYSKEQVNSGADEELYGFKMNLGTSAVNDQDITEDYLAGYIMSELKYKDLIIFTPGFRYEYVENNMQGWIISEPPFPAIQFMGQDTIRTRKNEFLLPMLHFKFKPTNWWQILFSYTETLHRPNFKAITPYEHYNKGSGTWFWNAGNPELNPELWNNFDVQVSFFSNKLGLLSVNGFYKTVEDKIWARNWTRIDTSTYIPHFGKDARVNVTTWLNQEYDVFVRGFETEWQTNFWYLPSPLNHFTLNLNYTFTDNETKYPYSKVKQVAIDTTARGRVIWEEVRTDSTFNGPMINQPRHIANASIGYNYKGFSAWLSFQYKDKILQSKSLIEQLDTFKNKFFRVDLQVNQKLPVEGLELLFNLANINDIQEKTTHRGDWRPSSLENYGWTANFGLRYAF